jgi:hypothetical protein
MYPNTHSFVSVHDLNEFIFGIKEAQGINENRVYNKMKGGYLDWSYLACELPSKTR